jgi:hypothetical protein
MATLTLAALVREDLFLFYNHKPTNAIEKKGLERKTKGSVTQASGALSYIYLASTGYQMIHMLYQKELGSRAPVVQACNPDYLGS